MRFTGQDSTDHGPETATRTGVQVESSLRPQLSSDGCFLDPEKYEPVKLLGSGGFAKVLLLIEGFGAKRLHDVDTLLGNEPGNSYTKQS